MGDQSSRTEGQACQMISVFLIFVTWHPIALSPEMPVCLPASGVVAGLIALHEKMPSGHGMKLIRLSSWICILLGVTSLAGGLNVITKQHNGRDGMIWTLSHQVVGRVGLHHSLRLPPTSTPPRQAGARGRLRWSASCPRSSRRPTLASGGTYHAISRCVCTGACVRVGPKRF